MRMVVPQALTEISAKAFLRGVENISNSMWRKLKKPESNFRVNGVAVKAATTILRAGDVVTWKLAGNENSNIEPENIPLSICYEDDFLLIVNEPSGMLVHPTGGVHSGTLANAILNYYIESGLDIPFRPVHRLDKNTSGLVLIAKDPRVQYALSTNKVKFDELPHSMDHVKPLHRHYIAISSGNFPHKTGVIDYPIGRKPGSIIERMVLPETEGGQAAITKYQVLAETDTAALLELSLETGRTHQIRVHLSSMGNPILGDDLYEGDTALISRQALHAYRMYFTHPITKEEINVTSQLPLDMVQLLKKLKFEHNIFIDNLYK